MRAETPESYGSTRPYSLPRALGDLVGPTSGRVVLPRRIYWGPPRDFDLDVPAQRRSYYAYVLNEAATVVDLEQLLDERLLMETWAELWLPERLRELWETAFPVLARRRATL